MTAREEAMVLALAVAWGRTPAQVRVHFPESESTEGCAMTSSATTANMASHGACGKSWHQSGNRTSHCGGCHETFASLAVFDSHRRDGKCLAPVDVTHNHKAPIAQRPDGIWYSPADAEAARAHFGNEVARPVAPSAGNPAPDPDIAAQEAVSDIGGYWFGQRQAVRDHNGERGAA